MDPVADILVPLLFAGAAGGLAIAVWHLLAGEDVARRRRLSRRLEGGARVDTSGMDPEQRVRLLRSREVGAFEELLGRWRLFDELTVSLKQAMPDLTLAKFLLLALASAVGTAVVVFSLRQSFIVSALAAMIGGYVPFVLVAQRRMRRQRALAYQLPDALEFLARTLRAGHSLPIGLQMLADELPQPLAGEFSRCHDQISLGTGPDVALKAMVDRIDSTDFAFFVTAVLVQRQTGGDLAQVLDNITSMLRQRVRLEQHVKAKTAEGRFTGYILAAFPLVMFVVLHLINPTFASPLVDTPTGNLLLLLAVILSITGLLVIRRLVAVRI